MLSFEKSSQLPKPVIEQIGDFFVLRDDLLHGGTKRRVLNTLFKKISNAEVVYAAHAYGYAQLALALSGQDTGKKVSLFYPSHTEDVAIYKETISFPNVYHETIKDVTRQADVAEYAKVYAQRNNAYFFPVGFNMREFSEELIKLATSLEVRPSEVWVLGGSGTLARALCIAWPRASINVVDLGMGHGDMGCGTVYSAPEKPEEKAKFPPPYPSAEYYDAKIWQFVSKFGKKGALIWNVA